MSDELRFMLESQVKVYRAIQKESPKSSDAYKAAKATADEAQRLIDCLGK